MKSFYFSLTIACLLLLSFQSARSQNQDYVINTKGDTIFCEITTPFFGGKDRYRTDAMPENKKITIDEIQEYYIARDDNRQRSVLADDATTPVFMKVVENGAINLYEVYYSQHLANNMNTSTTNWYVSKGKGIATPLKTSSLSIGKSRKERKEEFGELIKDKKYVYDRYIADNSFTFDEIRAIVQYYNTGVFTPPDYGDVK